MINQTQLVHDVVSLRTDVELVGVKSGAEFDYLSYEWFAVSSEVAEEALTQSGKAEAVLKSQAAVWVAMAA